MDMTRTPEKPQPTDDESVQRMNEALKAAMKMPPRKHKDETKRKKSTSTKRTVE